MPAVSMACGEDRHDECKGLAETVSSYAIPCACPCHRRKDMTMEKTRCPLGRAEEIANEVLKLLGTSCERIVVAGSIRRRKPEVGDIEILAIPKYGGLSCHVNLLDQEILDLMHRGILNFRLNKRGRRAFGQKNKLLVHLPSGMAVDVFSTDKQCWPVALVIRTGGAETNKRIAVAAIKKGWRLKAYGSGFSTPQGDIICKSEEDVFEFVGLPYLEPEQRE
jgi:DNA polymerase/3'-5' exonuclease PolX